jgi:hypothetical protein
MDLRKSTGRTAEELIPFFSKLPEATFCLDVAHAQQVDSTMLEAWSMLEQFGSRLRQVHISEIDSQGRHHGISIVTILGVNRIAKLIGPDVPVIIESQIPATDIDREIQSVERALRPPLVPQGALLDWGALA